MLDGKKILIVEDDPVFRTMIVGFLHSQGCIVQEAGDGLQGLRELKKNVPDILLCDLAMPVMTGMEFVEEVAVQYPAIPVIVISGTGNMTDVALALRLGVKDFLLKPIDNIMTLKSAIISVLKMEQNLRQGADQWQVNNDETGLVEEELQWHISELKHNPEAARELLLGLMPKTQANHEQWQLNYTALQSANDFPILFDYIWLMDGQLAFYVLDTRSAGEDAAATALLIRACFNDYLRHQGHYLISLQRLVVQIEQGMQYSGYASPIKGLFGVLNLSDRQLQLISAGIGARLQTDAHSLHIDVGDWLGDGATKNGSSLLQLGTAGGKLSLNDMSQANFSLNFKSLI